MYVGLASVQNFTTQGNERRMRRKGMVVTQTRSCSFMYCTILGTPINFDSGPLITVHVDNASAKSGEQSLYIMEEADKYHQLPFKDRNY